ncbi:hypothetical protein N7448_008499 [Penicillium atrosanguineum]|nr:hypothetical protein N7448_008499 [Penicillium atrosanguineum]
MGDSHPLAGHPCSRLECLPVEILQLIFLYSLEINLPRASPYLSRALSNPLLYTWLIRLAFSSTNPGSREGFFTPDFLPPPLDFWSLPWQQRQHLQTTILACKWCTLPLLRRCQREYVNHAIKRKCSELVFTPEDQARLNNLDKYFTDLNQCDQAIDGRRGKGDLVIPATLPNSKPRKLAIWFHFGAIQIREQNDIYFEADLFRLPSSVVIGPGRIPDKVFRAPWSESQFEFLQLLAGDFYLDDEFSTDRSARITTRLIRRRSIGPFKRLLGMYFRAANCRVPVRWPLQDKHYTQVRRYGSGAGDEFVSFILDKRWDEIPVSEKVELVQYIEAENGCKGLSAEY